MNMHLLYKVSPLLLDQLRQQSMELYHDAINDAHLPLRDLTYGPLLWLLKLRQLGLETTKLRGTLKNLHIAGLRIITKAHSLVANDVVNKFAEKEDVARGEYLKQGYFPKAVFHSVEACENQIVSDRVAIFSNVLELRQRLDTLGLSSYSMSLLNLLLANNCLPRILFRAELDDSRPKFPLIHSFKVSDLAKRLGKLDSGEDQQAIERVLLDLDPEKRDRSPKQELHAQLQDHSAGFLYYAVVVPVSATIQDLIDGIISPTSKKREYVTHAHDRRILRYAVDSDQLPRDAEFVAFYGFYFWQAEFVEKYF